MLNKSSSAGLRVGKIKKFIQDPVSNTLFINYISWKPFLLLTFIMFWFPNYEMMSAKQNDSKIALLEKVFVVI